jgi:GT2 family glycosyltransferase
MNEIAAIDVIILSYAQTDELKNVTVNAVQSLMDSESPEKIKFNVLVFESQKDLAPYQYEHTRTIYPKEEFGFHRYLNMGIKSTNSPYVCLCNNDLLFQKGWATEILNAFQQFQDVLSASPACPYYPAQIGIEPVREVWFGYRIAIEMQGSCLFFKRELLKHIGQLDPNFKFYYADDDYAQTLRVLNLRHMLVRSSIVFHLGSKTLRKQDAAFAHHLTDEQSVFYYKKWGMRLGKRWELID